MRSYDAAEAQLNENIYQWIVDLCCLKERFEFVLKNGDPP
jgi:hypothetical protein